MKFIYIKPSAKETALQTHHLKTYHHGNIYVNNIGRFAQKFNKLYFKSNVPLKLTARRQTTRYINITEKKWIDKK